MTEQSSNLEDQPDPELAQVLAQLSRRYPHLPEQWLHELARAVHEGFRDAPIRTFVPLLVEHQVVGAVRRTSATPSAAAGALPPPTPLRRPGREIGVLRSWWHSLTRAPTWPQSSPSADEAGVLPD